MKRTKGNVRVACWRRESQNGTLYFRIKCALSVDGKKYTFWFPLFRNGYKSTSKSPDLVGPSPKKSEVEVVIEDVRKSSSELSENDITIEEVSL